MLTIPVRMELLVLISSMTLGELLEAIALDIVFKLISL